MNMKKNIKNNKNKNNSKKKSKLTSLIDCRSTNVTFNIRFIAYVIDWVLGGILTGFPAVYIYAYVTQSSDMFGELYVFETGGYSIHWAYLAGILCVLLALFYYVFVPLKLFPGQTLGKKMMKIKIVTENNQELNFKALFIRQVVGLFMLESGSLVVCSYIRQLFSMATTMYVDIVWQWVGSILFMISAGLAAFTNSHRAFHDYLAKTKVIFVN